MLGLAVAAVLLLLPGWVLAGIASMPVLARAAVAPAASVGLWALSAGLLGVLGIAASPALTLAVLACLLAAVRLVRHRMSADVPPWRAWLVSPRGLTPVRVAVAAGVGGALLLGLHVWTTAWPSVQSLSRFSDMTWHGYVVALLSHGTPANPFTLVPVDPLNAGVSQPYPWGVHIIAALVQQTTGYSVPAALKATQVAFLAVAYPLGCATLALRAAPGRTRARVVAAVVAPVLAMGFNVFPWHIDPWLVFPCAVGLIPGTAVAAWTVAQRRAGSPAGQARGAAFPVGLGWLVVGVAAAGVTVVHPSATVALALLVLAGVLLGTRGLPEFAPRWQGLLRLVAPALVGLVLGAFFVGRTIVQASQVAGAQRAVSETFGWWLWVVATGGTRQPQTVLFWLMVVAAVCAVARRVMLGPVAFAAVFFALAASSLSSATGPIHALTGLWYHEGERLGALATVVIAPLVASQAAWLTDRALDLVAVPAGLAARAVDLAVVGAGALAVVVAVTWPQLGSNVSWVAGFYRPPPLSADGRAGFAWLRAHAGNQLVMNQVTGVGGWMYALDGVAPVIPHGSVAVIVPERGFLAMCLNSIDVDPRVRPLVDSLKIEYVFVDSGITTSGGLAGIETNPRFQPVERSGNVTVYRILAPGVGAAVSRPAPCTVSALPGWWLFENGPFRVQVTSATG